MTDSSPCKHTNIFKVGTSVITSGHYAYHHFNSSHLELVGKRPLKNADSNVHAHSAHINLVIGALLMVPFHYVKNNLLMLSLASPPLSRCVCVFFFFLSLRSHWQLYHLMRSDFIKEGGPSQPSPGLLTQTLQLATADGSRLELLGTEREKEKRKEEVMLMKLEC